MNVFVRELLAPPWSSNNAVTMGAKRPRVGDKNQSRRARTAVLGCGQFSQKRPLLCKAFCQDGVDLANEAEPLRGQV